mmetsp:Transcript_6963/g.13913  ORF Transcript_6963/g.13913 Transcript_6963/m.13913 type:complete len:710 (+) Transcript_6963:39-2168(+)
MQSLLEHTGGRSSSSLSGMERLKPSVSAGIALRRKQQQEENLRALQAEHAGIRATPCDATVTGPDHTKNLSFQEGTGVARAQTNPLQAVKHLSVDSGVSTIHEACVDEESCREQHYKSYDRRVSNRNVCSVLSRNNMDLKQYGNFKQATGMAYESQKDTSERIEQQNRHEICVSSIGNSKNYPESQTRSPSHKREVAANAQSQSISSHTLSSLTKGPEETSASSMLLPSSLPPKEETQKADQASKLMLKAGRSPRSPDHPSAVSNHKSPMKMRRREVVIHVRDKAHKLTRDFHCDKEVLVKEMPYFKPYLKDLHKMDISVHCDVHIFEWLMRRIRAPNEAYLEIRNVVSVLIASDFLGMTTLVSEAINFVVANLAEIVTLPVDLKCLTPSMVKQIASSIPLGSLIGVSDPRNKIVGSLFRIRTEHLLSKHGAKLAKCKYCSNLFSQRFSENLVCPQAPAGVDFHGRLCQSHEAQPEWDVVRDFIVAARQTSGHSWKKIYWTLWGVTRLFCCTNCESLFDGPTSHHCRLHPHLKTQETVLNPELGNASYSENRVYPCCAGHTNAPPKYFVKGTSSRDGCQRSAHHARATDFSNAEDVTYLVIYQHSHLPFKEDKQAMASKEQQVPLQDRPEALSNLTVSNSWFGSQEPPTQRGSSVQSVTCGVESLYPSVVARPSGGSSAYMLERQRDDDWVSMRSLAQKLQAMRRSTHL